MNKMNSLQYVKEHPKISNFLQFESHSSKSFKVRAISGLEILSTFSALRSVTPSPPCILSRALSLTQSASPQSSSVAVLRVASRPIE